jgi:hypothetical protein
MPEILQHAVVTIVAFGAAALVIRRVFTVVKPAGGSACAACPSAKRAAPEQPAPGLTAEAKPLTLFTSPPTSR